MYCQNKEVVTSFDVHSIQCIEGASGSAIKGVRLCQPPNTDSFWLATVGYDQRLSLWTVSKTETSKTKADQFSTIYFSNDTERDPGTPAYYSYEDIQKTTTKDSENCPLSWDGGAMVNIGDVNGMAVLSVENVEIISIVGEGLQILQKH